MMTADGSMTRAIVCLAAGGILSALHDPWFAAFWIFLGSTFLVMAMRTMKAERHAQELMLLEAERVWRERENRP